MDMGYARTWLARFCRWDLRLREYNYCIFTVISPLESERSHSLFTVLATSGLVILMRPIHTHRMRLEYFKEMRGVVWKVLAWQTAPSGNYDSDDTFVQRRWWPNYSP
jgi:hypothetical protein